MDFSSIQSIRQAPIMHSYYNNQLGGQSVKNVKKVDIHVHSRMKRGIPRYNQTNFALPEELIKMYESLGVEKGVLLPGVRLEAAFQLQTNEDVLEIVEKYPEHFNWFCNIDPRMGNNTPNADLSYFIEYYKDHGAKGVGEICANLYFDDPFVENLFYHCEKCEMPVIFHIGSRVGGCYGLVDELGLYRLEKELKKFPKLKFLGHSLCFWSEISADVNNENRDKYSTGKVVPGRVVELMRKYPNLLGDLSAVSGYNALTRDPEFAYSFIEEFQERLFFGTDIDNPHQDMKLSFWMDEALKNSKISLKAYTKVSRENALKLLGE